MTLSISFVIYEVITINDTLSNKILVDIIYDAVYYCAAWKITIIYLRHLITNLDYKTERYPKISITPLRKVNTKTKPHFNNVFVIFLTDGRIQNIFFTFFQYFSLLTISLMNE